MLCVESDVELGKAFRQKEENEINEIFFDD